MNADFEALASGAAYVANTMGVTYRTEYRDGNTWGLAGDENTEFAAAYDDWVESLKWFDADDLIVWAVHADGMKEDVTDQMENELARIMEARA